MRLRPLVLLLLVGTLSGCSDSNDDDDEAAPPPAPEPPANTVDFDVALSPDEVVGGGSSGSAVAEVTVDQDDGAVSGTVALTDLEAEGVTLSRGFAGETGEVLVALEETSASNWAFPADAILAQSDQDALEAGGLYLQVTSADAPDGAVRGQILPDGIQVLFVSLSGAQEVPPLDSDGSAEAALTVDAGDGDLVLHLNTSGLDDAAEAHIHDGVAGVNGPIRMGLVQDPDEVSHWFIDDFTLEAAELDALNGGGLYVNVHTPAHPAGEVRGQIEPDGVDVFFVTLSGEAVVPAVATEASGVAAATLLAASESLTLHVNLVGLDDAEAVELRQASVMQNGPLTVALEQDPNALSHWLAEDLTLTDAQQEALVDQRLYVSVTSPEFPDGELRGQLAPDDSAPGSADSFVVEAVSPDDGATVDALPDAIVVTFNRDLLPASAGTGQVQVDASGGDGSFNDGNELAVVVLAVAASGAELRAEIDTGAEVDDVYRILLDGSSSEPLTDTAGVVLDGDGDGTAGGDFMATFTVSAEASALTLSELQADIFTPSCAKSGCHAGPAPAQGMDLSDGQTFASTVGVASTEVPTLNRIEPGDPDGSYLVQKVEGTASVGGRMPLDGPPFLTNAQIQNIRDWIAAGAEDN